MSILTVIVVILVVGVILWLVNYIPMQLAFKSFLNAMTVIGLVIWILKVFGAFDSLQIVTI